MISMDFMTIVIGLVLSYAFIYVMKLSLYPKPNNLPPGPTPLPIIGSLHLLGGLPHRALTELAKRYGPIMFLRLGRIPTLVITSAAAAKQVLQMQDASFSNRNVPNAITVHNIHQLSSIWLPAKDPQWVHLRKFFKTRIFSKENLDANAHVTRQKVEELVAFCRKSGVAGEAVNITDAAFRTVFNLLANVMFSKNLTDPFQDSAEDLREMVVNVAVDIGKLNMADFFPVLTLFDPQRLKRRMIKNVGKMLDLFQGLIDERLEMKKSGQAQETKDDVLEACLKDGPHMKPAHMKAIFLELFIAGTDTTTNTLQWGMGELLRKPEAMTKAKEELYQVIGKGKIVEEADIPRLPYMQCIIKEILRVHPAGPLLIPRKTDEEVQIKDYVVPAGTLVLVNAWAIGRDETVWEDPSEFKPERFLDLKLDLQGHNFELITFGAGRRMCPGVPLAIRMLPVMLGSLLNCFDWKLEDGMEPKDIDMRERFGLSLAKDVNLLAIPIPLT